MAAEQPGTTSDGAAVGAPDDLPLAGVLVLDLSQFLAGPVAALRLADMGARVIKVERPRTGEIGRTLAFAGRWRDGDTLSFHAMNRGKESVVADLKDPEDLAAVRALVERADVVVQNFRPGVMERLGLDFATLRELNPRLVYASASGYGAEGPWASRPGQDLLAQSVSALPWVNVGGVSGSGERPVPVGLALADHLLSCHLAQGVCAMLVRAARTGVGGLVESSLLEGVLDLGSELLTARLNGGPVPPSVGPHSAHGWLPAPYGTYPTADGHLSIAMAPVDLLGRLLDEPVLAGLTDPDEWWSRRAEVEKRIADVLATAGTDHWLTVLDAADVWCAPLLDLEQLLAHDAFAALGMTQEVRRPGREPGEPDVAVATVRSPLRVDGVRPGDPWAAPRLGEQGHVRDAAALLAGRPDRAAGSP
ncbi:CaiB/BaiF CoA transferase family protein [Nocardioides bruguierae]|uniref:CaiB/BaiF CoA transferase family protein n=1 Tax=Nocardioides bruguierae TaxID=2945102 RepID=UPI0020210E98|nr:CaiB/BaiF CoA-transferase family protein [Nocardioides bruguierae]MCL8025483.1 CoA transferase [Nocardioides bruguierae]